MGVYSFCITIFLMAMAILEWASTKANADDIGTNFFLKTSKSVPRIGRRSMMDFDNYFLKASKSVPRIGRRRDLESEEIPASLTEKRFLSEKVPLEWGGIDQSGKDYPEAMQADEPYRLIEHYPDVYWQQIKKKLSSRQ